MSDEELMRRNEAARLALRELEAIGGDQEQSETWDYLERVLDEDRLSDRKLFP